MTLRLAAIFCVGVVTSHLCLAEESKQVRDMVGMYIERITFPQVTYSEFTKKVSLPSERQREIFEFLNKNHLMGKAMPPLEFNAKGEMRLKGEPDGYFFRLIADSTIAMAGKKIAIDKAVPFERTLGQIREAAGGKKTAHYSLLPEAQAADSSDAGVFAAIVGAARSLNTTALNHLGCLFSNVHPQMIVSAGPFDPANLVRWKGCSSDHLAKYLVASDDLREINCEGSKLQSTVYVSGDQGWKWIFKYAQLDGNERLSAVTHNLDGLNYCTLKLDSKGAVANVDLIHPSLSVRDSCIRDFTPELACCERGKECTDAVDKYVQEIKRKLLASPSETIK